jgi:hypothetical protein
MPRAGGDNGGVRRQDPRVPVEVEEYLVSLNASAGELGGRIGGRIGGALGADELTARAGARGGSRGGAFGARMLKTIVEERSGTVPGKREEVLSRFRSALADAREVARQGDLVRLAVPWGRTGLQQVVIDLRLSPREGAPDQTACEVLLRAYCKEGLINRKPTAVTADRAWAAISSDSA